MERVSKFFVPGQLTLNTSAFVTGTGRYTSQFYSFPIGTFPLMPGYSCVIKWANLLVIIPSTSTAVGTFLGGLLVIFGVGFEIVSFPAFPVAPSNFIGPIIGGTCTYAFPVIPPPSFEWDDFASYTPGQPISLLGTGNFNITTAGSFSVAFNALIEVWKI